MLVVTGGKEYIDIDAYAACIAYAELLRLQGKEAVAASNAVLNQSITPRLLSLVVDFHNTYSAGPDDEFIIIDLSHPDFFDKMVTNSRVVEIIDHHPGFEEYWQEHLGSASVIDQVGAACTLIYEAWEKSGIMTKMKPITAKLLAAGILDNTLNFRADITCSRDKAAYEFLQQHANLGVNFPSQYFADCQKQTDKDIVLSLKTDKKMIEYPGLSGKVCGAQLAVWSAEKTYQKYIDAATKVFCNDKNWMINIISISEGRNYIYCSSTEMQPYFAQLLDVSFSNGLAKTERLWLRKEIMRRAIEQNTQTGI